LKTWCQQALLTGGTSKVGVVELAEEIFHMPVPYGYPQTVRGLNDIVRNPITPPAWACCNTA
jgi:cell division ATPase FtsA